MFTHCQRVLSILFAILLFPTLYLIADQMNNLNLRIEDEEQIRDIIENPIGIVILGSKSWSKATVVNELLGYTLLPVHMSEYGVQDTPLPNTTTTGIATASAALNPSDQSTSSSTTGEFETTTPKKNLGNNNNGNWRTIRLMYGPQTQVSLAVSNQYELVEHLAVYDRMWHQTPRSDLEVNLNLWQESQSPSDPGYCSATLEIKLPHHVLAEDTQIIVAPTVSAGHVNFETIYHTCFDGVSPVVIYALSDSDSLSPQEVDDLMELQRLSPKIPVFFVRTHRSPPPTSRLHPQATPAGTSLIPDHLSVNSASELTESQQHVLFSTNAILVEPPTPKTMNFPPFPLQAPSSSSGIPRMERMMMRGMMTDFPNIGSSPPKCASQFTMPTPPSSCASPMLERSDSDVKIGSPADPPTLLTNYPDIRYSMNQSWFSSVTLFQQLISLGFLNPCRMNNTSEFESSALSPSGRKPKKVKSKDGLVYSELIENFDQFPCVQTFIRQVLQSHLVRAANTLHALHSRCLKVFILTAFDMTRDMMITPKRISYAREKEQQLYESLMSIANRKQEEIKQMISDTLNGMRSDLLQEVAFYQFKHNFWSSNGVACCHVSESVRDSLKVASCSIEMHSSSLDRLTSGGAGGHTEAAFPKVVSHRDYQTALSEIQDFVLSHLNAAIAGKLIGSVDCLRDSYVGTLERCLQSLEKVMADNEHPSPTTTTSGERGSSSSLQGHHLTHQSRIEASNALKSILNAAYQVEINMKTTSSLLRVFWEKIKAIVSSSWIWAHQPVIDVEWKMRVASDILDSLSESRLATSICSQFRERLKASHENFLTAIKQLESVHSVRLEKTEEHRLKVRKVYAPKIARYALESVSLRDLILHGMPQLGREIGRGQYGVVYSCDSWGGYSPVALKSVVPPDDKHWNDLAMEFYYTRSIPDHERIVQIRGSVIDHSYGGGSSPAVLLIMDRLSRDLYSAIKSGLDLLSRLQVAIDVVQGIRFLHSQGLVHRDIKLKNVLLDKRNRAKITDLGFCKPEAMMSGSIVGTPIHMAPELFSGKYDSSVDVYAFGILFWYICAGHVRLPYIFEQCQNKDQLWSCVRKGSRPERLPVFDDDCWNIMERCWAGDPTQRPLLGDIEPKLVAILDKYKATNRSTFERSVARGLPSSYSQRRRQTMISPRSPSSPGSTAAASSAIGGVTPRPSQLTPHHQPINPPRPTALPVPPT